MVTALKQLTAYLAGGIEVVAAVIIGFAAIQATLRAFPLFVPRRTPLGDEVEIIRTPPCNPGRPPTPAPIKWRFRKPPPQLLHILAMRVTPFRNSNHMTAASATEWDFGTALRERRHEGFSIIEKHTLKGD